jgi:hypothetical protein
MNFAGEVPAMLRLNLLPVIFVQATLCSTVLHADEPKKVEAKVKEIAGTAEFLRGVPKHFATLKAVDPARQRVTLLIEGETLAKTWDLMPDAEVKVLGWWGRLDQFPIGDRVWVWFQNDRKKQPVAVMMIADEPSEQDIHETVWTLAESKGDAVVLHPAKGPDRTLKLSAPSSLAKGTRVRFQSAGDKVRVLMDEAEFEKRREEQKLSIRKRWEGEGLPGTVTFLHQQSGELELMLDHEAMRWARSMKPGDSVTVAAESPIKAVVRSVKPWRERTQVRLVAAAEDQGDLRIGLRTRLKVPTPSQAVLQSSLPPDVGGLQAKAERIEWFLASIYCTCTVRGNICTGHFYTLASCNPNGCGQPNAMRKQLAKLIDEGKSDEEIFEILLKEQGPGLLRPHLLP